MQVEADVEEDDVGCATGRVMWGVSCQWKWVFDYQCHWCVVVDVVVCGSWNVGQVQGRMLLRWSCRLVRSSLSR